MSSSNNNNFAMTLRSHKKPTTPEHQLVVPDKQRSSRIRLEDLEWEKYGYPVSDIPLRRIVLTQSMMEKLDENFKGEHTPVLDSVLDKLYELGIDDKGRLTRKKIKILLENFVQKPNEEVYKYEIGVYVCHDCSDKDCLMDDMLEGWTMFGGVELGVALRVLVHYDYNFEKKNIEY